MTPHSLSNAPSQLKISRVDCASLVTRLAQMDNGTRPIETIDSAADAHSAARHKRPRDDATLPDSAFNVSPDSDSSGPPPPKRLSRPRDVLCTALGGERIQRRRMPTIWDAGSGHGDGPLTQQSTNAIATPTERGPWFPGPNGTSQIDAVLPDSMIITSPVSAQDVLPVGSTLGSERIRRKSLQEPYTLREFSQRSVSC